MAINDLLTINKIGSSDYGPNTIIVFNCDFCLKIFESKLRSFNRLETKSKHQACTDCRSISASYTHHQSNVDPHQYFLSKRAPLHKNVNVLRTLEVFGYDVNAVASGSSRKIICHCEFCLNEYETLLSIIYSKSLISCKKCDAVAASYSRVGNDEDKHQFFLKRRPDLTYANIDIDATIQKYGYGPKDISQHSHKRIIALCKYCRIPLDIPMSKYTFRKENIACKEHLRQKTVETLKEKYGYECTLMIPSILSKLKTPNTENIVASILDSRYKIDYVRNHALGPYEFDFYVPSCDLLIECQGDYFHKFKEFGYSGTPKDRAKSSYIESNTSHKLVWIYEHEIHVGRINKILDYHIYKISEPDVDLDLKELSFRKIDNQEAHAFLSQYHYLGNLGTIATCYGAYKDSLLICVCVFGGLTRQQSILKLNKHFASSYGPKNIKELRRFCIRPKVNCKNLASFSLKRFMDLCKIDYPSVQLFISFADQSVDDVGTIYKASNWEQLSNTPKSYHYLDPKTNKHLHKKTVWDMARHSHMKEWEFVHMSGLLKVDEMHKTVWARHL